MLSERIGGPGVFTDFAKEKEMLLALGVDGISVCFEVEFVIDCCPKYYSITETRSLVTKENVQP